MIQGEPADDGTNSDRESELAIQAEIWIVIPGLPQGWKQSTVLKEVAAIIFRAHSSCRYIPQLTQRIIREQAPPSLQGVLQGVLLYILTLSAISVLWTLTKLDLREKCD